MVSSNKVTYAIILTVATYMKDVASKEVCNFTRAANFSLKDDAVGCDFVALDPLFYLLLEGTNNSIDLMMENEEPIFHEGPTVFDKDEHALYFASNRLGNISLASTGGSVAPAQLEQYINTYRLDLDTNELEMITPDPKIPMANGARKTPDRKNILWVGQGFNETSGGIYQLDRNTLKSTPILESHYGSSFNSLNDIASTTDGLLFFSDPSYGFEQGFRQGNPVLGNNVYRYNMATNELKALATILKRPNGVALLDRRYKGQGCTLFLTDTGDSRFFAMRDTAGCFDTGDAGTTWDSSLIPMELHLGDGIQDGIQVHQQSELMLYCGTGTGVWVHSTEYNKLLGVIQQPCTQLSFASDFDKSIQNVYLLNEKQLYSTKLNFGNMPEFDIANVSSSSRPFLETFTIVNSIVVSLLAIANM